MKKIILTIIAVFTLITVNAQFGAKAGINHAKFSGDIDATSFITGFQLVFCMIQSIRPISLHLEYITHTVQKMMMQ